MKEAIAFCLSMMLSGLLGGEVRFGRMKPGKPSAPEGAKTERIPDQPWTVSHRLPPPEDSGSGVADAGKPAPLHSRPGHHLVAANALPPGAQVYLLPKD